MHPAKPGTLQRNQVSEQMMLWPEHAHLNTRFGEKQAMPSWQIAGAKAIYDQPDIDPTGCRLAEGFGNAIANAVIRVQIGLKANALLRLVDGRQ
jgi:hypothetical protein